MWLTWEQVHVGDLVEGHDRLTYWVSEIILGDPRGPSVTIVRDGVATGPAQPAPGTPIFVVWRADTSAEAGAFAVLQQAGLDPAVIRESYEP
jgi:hypothetical protein